MIIFSVPFKNTIVVIQTLVTGIEPVVSLHFLGLTKYSEHFDQRKKNAR